MTVANLGRQYQRSLDSYSKRSWKHLYLFGVMSYWFIPSILLNNVVHIFKLIMLMFMYSLNNTRTLHPLEMKRDPSLVRKVSLMSTFSFFRWLGCHGFSNEINPIMSSTWVSICTKC
jgi:hypothetical protein